MVAIAVALAPARFRAEADGGFDPSPTPLATFDRGGVTEGSRTRGSSPIFPSMIPLLSCPAMLDGCTLLMAPGITGSNAFIVARFSPSCGAEACQISHMGASWGG